MSVSCPGVASCVSPSSAGLGVGYAPGVGHRSSSSHHLVRRGRLRSHPPSCPSHLPGVISSHRDWFSCGGRRTFPFISLSRLILIELVKTAQNVISRSSSSDVPGLLVPRLVLSSRGASRALFVIVMISRGDGRVLRSCSFLSRRGRGGMPFACPAAWRRACPHPSPIVSFCFSSFRLVLPSRPPSRAPISCEPDTVACLLVSS